MLNDSVAKALRLANAIAWFPINQLCWASDSRLISTPRNALLFAAALSYYAGFLMIWMAAGEARGLTDFLVDISDGAFHLERPYTSLTMLVNALAGAWLTCASFAVICETIKPAYAIGWIPAELPYPSYFPRYLAGLAAIYLLALFACSG